jgi:hypothetical protein
MSMKNEVTIDLLRDFFVMLGPKRPVGYFDLTVVPEIVDRGRLYHVFQFEIPDELKKELSISDNMLPMFASSIEKLLLSKMVNKGVNGKTKDMLNFVQELPKFKKTIDNYFKNQNLKTVFEFK